MKKLLVLSLALLTIAGVEAKNNCIGSFTTEPDGRTCENKCKTIRKKFNGNVIASTEKIKGSKKKGKTVYSCCCKK